MWSSVDHTTNRTEGFVTQFDKKWWLSHSTRESSDPEIPLSSVKQKKGPATHRTEGAVAQLDKVVAVAQQKGVQRLTKPQSHVKLESPATHKRQTIRYVTT